MPTGPTTVNAIFRRRAFGLAVLLVVAAGVAGWHVWTRAPGYAGRALNVAQAHAQATAGTILLIDIRRPDEWKRTGIGLGAQPLDMRRDDFTAALEALRTGAPNRPIALICARGVRSARLANRLAQAGMPQIIDVPEGMLGSSAGPGWLGAGLPVRKWDEGSG